MHLMSLNSLNNKIWGFFLGKREPLVELGEISRRMPI